MDNCYTHVGPEGLPGDLGRVGTPAGNMGQIGVTGNTGRAGPTGEQGDMGPTGPIGERGKGGSLIINGIGPPIGLPDVENPLLYLDQSNDKLYYYKSITWIEFINITGAEGPVGPVGPVSECSNTCITTLPNMLTRHTSGYSTISDTLVDIDNAFPYIVIFPGVGPSVSITTSWNINITITQDTLIRIRDIVRYGLSYESSVSQVISDRRFFISSDENNFSFTNIIKLDLPNSNYNLYFTPQWSIRNGELSIVTPIGGGNHGYSVQVVSQ
jgi:hypothetical protein